MEYSIMKNGTRFRAWILPRPSQLSTDDQSQYIFSENKLSDAEATVFPIPIPKESCAWRPPHKQRSDTRVMRATKTKNIVEIRNVSWFPFQWTALMQSAFKTPTHVIVNAFGSRFYVSFSTDSHLSTHLCGTHTPDDVVSMALIYPYRFFRSPLIRHNNP